MSNQFGYCPASSFGLLSLASLLIQGNGDFPGDVDGAIKLGKMSMIIAQGSNALPGIELASITDIRILKEPLQGEKSLG